MKKILFLTLTALLLNGCSDKNNYEAAVLAELQREKNSQDPKDYNVPAEKMADCIVETSAGNMPGLFPLDPARLTSYRNYAKMLTLPESADPKKTMEELRNDFGSPKELAAARSNYIESEMDCLASFLANTEDGEKAKSDKPQ
ncbi:MAG: hypothetical protein RL755_1331 [Pseudomonadota bacterium]|jgi:hypothetical protein